MRFAPLVLLMLLACGEYDRAWLSGQKTYRVPSAAMAPTIAAGEHVIAEPLEAGEVIRHGEIVVFRYPRQESLYAKRVIAIGGQTVEVRNKRLFVDGKAAGEPYAVHSDPQTYDHSLLLPEPFRSRDNFGPVTVAADHFFMLGDNRDQSADSRFWGTVPRNRILARVVRIGPEEGPFRDAR